MSNFNLYQTETGKGKAEKEEGERAEEEGIILVQQEIRPFGSAFFLMKKNNMEEEENEEEKGEITSFFI